MFSSMKDSKHSRKDSTKRADMTSTLLTGLPFEEKFWYFWNKYSRYIILVSILLVLGFLGYQGMSLYKKGQIKELQEQYRVAFKEGREREFAEANIKEPLAGSVFLLTGDKFIDEANYDQAIENYKKALISLKSTIFGGRARLGIAFAAQMKVDLPLAKKLFQELVDDSKIVGAIRGEAAFHMALLSLEEKDFSKAREYIDIIGRLPNAGIWTQKATLLRDSTPELVHKI